MVPQARMSPLVSGKAHSNIPSSSSDSRPYNDVSSCTSWFIIGLLYHAVYTYHCQCLPFSENAIFTNVYLSVKMHLKMFTELVVQLKQFIVQHLMGHSSQTPTRACTIVEILVTIQDGHSHDHTIDLLLSHPHVSIYQYDMQNGSILLICRLIVVHLLGASV